MYKVLPAKWKKIQKDQIIGKRWMIGDCPFCSARYNIEEWVEFKKEHTQKSRGVLWHFDLTTDKWRLKSGYVGYKHKLKYGKTSDG